MGCPLIGRCRVLATAATLAAVALFAATAAASAPHEGSWNGDGINFRVVHEGGHTRVVDIHWHGGTSYGPDYVHNGEFSSCYSFSTAHFYSVLFCLDGKFGSPHEATGTVRSFLVAGDGWGRTAQRERTRTDWNASLEQTG